MHKIWQFFLSKSLAFFKNHDQFLLNLKLKFSIFINIYAQDYVDVNITRPSKSRRRHCFGGDNPAKPHNSNECRRGRSCRQLVIAVGSYAPLDVRGVTFSAVANVGQWSPPKDEETDSDKNSLASSNRLFSSPFGEECHDRGTSADRRSPIQKKTQYGQLWSGRRIHKMICRHLTAKILRRLSLCTCQYPKI